MSGGATAAGVGIRAAAAALAALAALACGGGVPPPESIGEQEHAAQVAEWRQWRHDELARPDGWLSLIGLFWLAPGDNVLGADPDADLVVARQDAPGRIGTFHLALGAEGRPGDAAAVFDPAPGVPVAADGEPFAGGPVRADDHEDGPTMLSLGTLSWFVIRRDDRLGVRLKDSASPLLLSFTGMEYFPVTPRWRLPGRFEAYDPPRTIKVPNVLGTIGDTESPGAAVFEIDGRELRLDLWKDSDDPANFFTAFGDESNGDSTYGAGRFLWIDAPDEHGRIVVDFNRAYNPPCVFTAFATCPLPPLQNRLPARIEAGESSFASPLGTH